MAIVIDATSAGASANSYATITEAEAYFAANLAFSAVWTAMEGDEKAARLVRAAQAIDRLEFVADRYVVNQALQFPRSTQEAAMIPETVKRAQCEMVIHLYADADAATGRSSGTREIEAADVDGVASVAYADAPDREGRETAAGGSLNAFLALLRPWLAAAGNSFDWTR